MASESLPSLLIRGGRIIDPQQRLDATGDLLIREGRIAAIETSPGRLTRDDADEVIDAEGRLVTPGLIDIHVHLREPGPSHEETIRSGAEAAVRGGFTTVCCMPNTTPALDSAAQVHFVTSRAAEADQARVFVVACATRNRKGAGPVDYDAIAAAGAVGFTDDGDVIADAGIMRETLRAARRLDRVVMQHCQEPTLTRGAAMNEGPVAERLGQIGWPKVAEELIIERDVRLNRDIGARYHAQHLSSGGSVEILRRAQQAGQPVTGEVSPHHLLLTEAHCETLGPMAKMNPPLRTEADIAMLKSGVEAGVITVLGTDHAPHPLATKQVDFARASFGIVGLECALPLYARALIDEGPIDWPAMIAMMTLNPARVAGLDRLGLGRLAVGGPADVTLIDPDHGWTIRADMFASAGRNCPFDEWDVRGRAVEVIVGGRRRLQPVCAGRDG